MKEFLVHLEYAKLLGLISLGVIIITYITHRIFRGYNRLIKYIPSIVLIGIGLFYLDRVGSRLTPSEDLKNIIYFIIGVGGGVVGLLSGLILGVYNKEKRP